MAVSYLPTEGLSYDPSEPRYWHGGLLQKELTRTFEVCHGCRMCFKFCDSFPTLFSLLDNKYDGDVRRLTEDDNRAIADGCFQCKLCEVQCPYTVRDEHEFQLDFPKLIHRYRAQQLRREGRPLRRMLLSAPDLLGKLARASFGLANKLNRVRAHRWMMEKMLGVHRDKWLPDFAAAAFDRWAAQAGRLVKADDEPREAILFQTCYVQHNEPQIGRDTLDVLDANGVDCGCVGGLNCCGMPAWEQGDLEQLRRQAHENLDRLMPLVDAGAKILVINPTCSMTMRREYPELLEGEDRERALRLVGAVQDVSEYLWSIRREDRFNTHVASRPEGTLAYHAPCHLRAQAIGFRGRDLLRKVLGITPVLVTECCGHDGTYALTTEGFEPSQRAGQNAFDEMKAAETELWATDCPLAALQFAQHAGVRPMHPMTLLARAYRGEGFDPPADVGSP